MYKKAVSLALSICLILGISTVFFGCNNTTNETAAETVDFKTTQNVKDGTILQCFCWDFNTITSSMADIVAAGFSAIQTSPINQCYEGENGGMQLYGNGKWYYHYQPTDWTIGNYQLGTRDEFKKMCETAHKYGIKVLVDVIPNHTTPTKEAISQKFVDAVGGWDKLYHQNSTNDIVNWGNRLQSTTYKMGGLPDVNTENPKFQDYFFDYINDCIACGADGFRYDTAKHIGLPDDPKEDDGYENNFWTRAVKDVDNAEKLFIYGEVLQGDNDRIEDYIKTIGATTASTYGSKVRSCVKNRAFSLSELSNYGVGDAPLNLVTWVESHDNYINDGTYSELDDNDVILAWSLITARKDGTPLFFDRPYGATATNSWGTMNRIGVSGSYIYKDNRVAAVNRFRTAMVGEDEKLVNPNDDNSAIMIERETKGAVIINLGSELETGFETSLADGVYVDRVDNSTKYTVKGGKLTSEKPIAEKSVVVLYNEGYINYAKPAQVLIDDVDCNYEGDSLEVTLRCTGTENAVYSINDAEEISYTDGTTITIKPSENSNVTFLTLKAKNSLGLPTYMKYCFTQKIDYKVVGDDIIFFIPPNGWGENITATLTDSSGTTPKEKEIKLTKEGNSYTYTFDEPWVAPKMVFSDGKNTYPSDNKPIDVEADKVYRAE